MLNALIQNGNQTAILELPADPFTLQYELAQIGIRSRLRDIPIKDDEDSEIQVKLFADSDIGNSLAVLFKPSYYDGLSDPVSLKEADMIRILDRLIAEHGLSYTESCFDRLDGKAVEKEKHPL